MYASRVVRPQVERLLEGVLGLGPILLVGVSHAQVVETVGAGGHLGEDRVELLDRLVVAAGLQRGDRFGCLLRGGRRCLLVFLGEAACRRQLEAQGTILALRICACSDCVSLSLVAVTL